MNLITDPWIPVRSSQGLRRISPLELPSSRALSPASPRADFDAAIYEFLIGLYQTCCAPADEMTWEEWIDSPPSRTELQGMFRPFLNAFRLDHPDHPFLQETGLSAEPASPLCDLLIDTPGEATVDDNKDHFVKRRPAGAACATCATLALFTLQAFAPAGGRGNMTSIRGGGPISSIVMGNDLWNTVWVNVLPRPALDVDKPAVPSPELLPWLHPADPPKGKRAQLHLGQVHPLHQFWGMPRRILLSGSGSETCFLCGSSALQGYSTFQARPYGFDYKGSWHHPLSPTQENKGEISARKGRADLGGYRQWIGLVAASDDGSRRPAQVVHHYRSSPRQSLIGRARLRAAGYAMDNAKVDGWYEGTMHLLAGDDTVRSRVDDHARRLVKATDEAASLLRLAYKEAWYDRPKDVRGDLSHLAAPLWIRTEPAFYASLERVSSSEESVKPESIVWATLLRDEVRSLFATHVQYTRLGDANPQRIIQAESKMNALLLRNLTKALSLTRDDLALEIPA